MIPTYEDKPEEALLMLPLSAKSTKKDIAMVTPEAETHAAEARTINDDSFFPERTIKPDIKLSSRAQTHTTANRSAIMNISDRAVLVPDDNL